MEKQLTTLLQDISRLKKIEEITGVLKKFRK